MSSESRKPLIRIRTLRGRLTVWHLTTLVLTLGVFAALLYGAVSRSLYEHHDGALRRQASELAARLREGPLTEPAILEAIAASATTPRFVMIRDAGGKLLFEEPVLHSHEPNIGQHEALVHAAREGRQDAWDAIVDRFLPLVGAIIRRHRLSEADGDDVSQTVWLRLVEHLDALREPEALPGWIRTTTRNE